MRPSLLVLEQPLLFQDNRSRSGRRAGRVRRMDRAAFADLVRQGPLAGDGGTGTSLAARGARSGFDLLTLRDRDLVRAVHASFVEAGAQVVETNTFGANRFKLGADAGLVQELNVAGVARAREAGARIVAGSIGPLGVRLAPYGRVPVADATAAFAEQARALAEGGADLLLLETFSDVAEAMCAVEGARSVCDLPVAVTFTFTRDDRTELGETPEDAAARARDADVDALGVNCSEGPEQVLRLIEIFAKVAPGIPLIAQPNAGGPQRLGDRMLFSASEEYFGTYTRAFAAAGTWLIGGCCGTRPEHIAAVTRALAEPRRVEVVEALGAPPEDAPSIEVTGEVPAAALGGFGRALEVWRGTGTAGAPVARTIVAVEMEPPRGVSAARLVAAAATLRDAGADVVNVADSPRARMRMSPWAACHLVQREAGIDTVLHFPTRGRNLLRIQSDLLAAYALGVRSIFAVMGDPTHIGDFPDAADLQDVTPSGLVALVKGQLNAGIDRGGSSIGEATAFVAGVALNPNAADPEREMRALARKVGNGADFILTQPVFDPSGLSDFLAAYAERYGALEVPVLAGLLPVVSGRHAEFLHNEVPGIVIGEDVRRRIAQAADERAEGALIAAELVGSLAGKTAGVYLIPPFHRYDFAAEIVDLIRRR